MQRNGKVQIVAELANYYGVVDEYGHCPASLRSLRFLLPQGLPMLTANSDQTRHRKSNLEASRNRNKIWQHIRLIYDKRY